MILDEQLFRNYNELKKMILQGYQDVAILNSFEQMRKNQDEFPETVKGVANHFIVLCQKDLALTIWKIKLDTNPNANTVSQFRGKIGQELRKSDPTAGRIKKYNLDSTLETELTNMRKRYLAHTDMTRGDSQIKISELESALNGIRGEFNATCNVIDDDRVQQITEGEIARVNIGTGIGMNTIFHKGLDENYSSDL